MVELVIKIPEKEYNAILNNDYIAVYACPFLLSEAIKNGALLPKGHGRLIDADELIKDYGNPDIEILLENMETIIEAEEV